MEEACQEKSAEMCMRLVFVEQQWFQDLELGEWERECEESGESAAGGTDSAGPLNFILGVVGSHEGFESVQFSRSVLSDSATPWTAARQASLSITNSRSLLKLMPIESVMPSNHLILCHPLLLPPSIFPSIRVFSNELVLRIRWPQYWSFNFSISPSNEYWGLIAFRMDWLDLLAVQGTRKSLLQHHSSKGDSDSTLDVCVF